MSWRYVFARANERLRGSLSYNMIRSCRQLVRDRNDTVRVGLSGSDATIAPGQVLGVPAHCIESPDAKLTDVEKQAVARQAAAAITMPSDWRDRASSNAPISIMFVRDPFTRLLSGFLEKVAIADSNTRSMHGLPRTKNTVSAFREFASKIFAGKWPLLFNASQESAMGPRHFAPLSQQCGFGHGARYDLYLRVEEMALWYEPLIKLLGIEHDVDAGWDQKTPFWHGSNRTCFFATPQTPCERMFNGREQVSCKQDDGRPSSQAARPSGRLTTTVGGTYHSRGSATKLTEYYSVAIARQAAE